MGLNVGLIQESFGAVKPHAIKFVEHFYEELFGRYPQAQALFKNVNWQKQRKALANSLAHIVEFLEDEEHLTDYLRKMGERHSPYGTQPEHFAWVGEALLATFEYFFDEQWTSELKENWTMAYTFVAEQMQIGMARAKTKNRGNVVEVPRDALKREEKVFSLSELSLSLAQELFKKAIQEELNNPEFQAEIKQRAKELLKQALETEAQEMLTEVRAHTRTA